MPHSSNRHRSHASNQQHTWHQESLRTYRASRAVANWYDEIFYHAGNREGVYNPAFYREIRCLVDYLALLSTSELEALRREYDRHSPHSRRKSLRERLLDVERMYDDYLEKHNARWSISKLCSLSAEVRANQSSSGCI